MQGLPDLHLLVQIEKSSCYIFGKRFSNYSDIDTKSLKVIKSFKFNGKVLHVRWLKSDNSLYVSVNDANQISVINTKDWFLEREIFQVTRPSGIFVYER